MKDKNNIYLFTGLLIMGFLFMRFGNLNQQKYMMMNDRVIKRMSDGALYEKGVVIIKFKTEQKITGKTNFGIANLDKILAEHSVKNIVQCHPLNPYIAKRKMGDEVIARIYKIEYNSEKDPFELSGKILNTNRDIIDWAEPSFVYTSAFVPNDSLIGYQAFLTQISTYQGWDITQGDTNVVIGIVDSGSDLDHPDLAANIKYNYLENPTNGIDDDTNGKIDDWRGWDFCGANVNNMTEDNDPNIYTTYCRHGSQVSGCASEVTNNITGGAGVGFKTKLLITKHRADNDNSSHQYNSTNGIVYCYQNNADVINCSWGSSTYSAYMQDVINAAWANGSVIVAAAGNDNLNVIRYPAGYDNVVSVAATDQNDNKALFSNYHSSVDICAPGTPIWTTAWNNTYISMGGTSLASPIISGTVALMIAKYPGSTPQQLVSKLLAGVDSIYHINPGYVGLLGTGRVNVYKCLQGPIFISISNGEVPAEFKLGQNYPNPFNAVTSIKFKVASVGQSFQTVSLKVFDLLGKEVTTLINEKLQPGTYEITFDAGDLPSGVYFYKLTAGVFIDTKKMLMIK